MPEPSAADPRDAHLQRDWTFAATRAPLLTRLSRLKSLATGRRAPPPHAALRPIGPAGRWNAYFLYLPDGRIEAFHLFTLERLRALPGRLCLVCAAPAPEQVPAALLDQGDALYWKGLGGYDFSAYRLLLDEIVRRAAGADLFVMNDSVLGPFAPLEPLLAAAPWDLTGFTASLAPENHLQSYAFFLRGVDAGRRAAFGPALPANAAYDRYRDVVNLQETRFARYAARRMSVGALWHGDSWRGGDPSLWAADLLLARGFPFLKRSLLGRNAALQDQARLRAFLEEQGHPPL